MTRQAWLNATVCVALAMVCGCSSSATRNAPREDEAAKEKVKAIATLADELAKDQEGAGAHAALEQFRIMSLDANKHPEQAKEIAEIYKQRIQGKYQGSVARELQIDIVPYLGKKK